jgi:phospholipid/cholesterol/gamma-HCH transport system substrate-binding protein
MISRITYVLVGVFVLILGGALVGGVLWLGAGGPRPVHRLYETYIPESVYGLSRDASVTYRGVEVGRVLTIELDQDDPKRVHLLLEIREGTPVRKDTVATLEVQALTGLAHVDLSGGSPGSPDLEAEPGRAHPVIPSKPSVLGTLDQKLDRLMADIEQALGRWDQLLRDENQAKITGILTHLEAVTGQLSDVSARLPGLVEGASTTLDHAREASTRMPALVEQLQRSALALESMAQQISGSVRGVGQAAETSLGNIDRATLELLPDARAMLAELRRTAENLRRVSEALERDPTIVVYGARTPRRGPGE